MSGRMGIALRAVGLGAVGLGAVALGAAALVVAVSVLPNAATRGGHAQATEFHSLSALDRPMLLAAASRRNYPNYPAGVPSPMAAPQNPPQSTPARFVGWCQCIDDRTVIQAMCQPSPASCQAACAGGHYSFLPYAQQTCAARY